MWCKRTHPSHMISVYVRIIILNPPAIIAGVSNQMTLHIDIICDIILCHTKDTLGVLLRYCPSLITSDSWIYIYKDILISLYLLEYWVPRLGDNATVSSFHRRVYHMSVWALNVISRTGEVVRTELNQYTSHYASGSMYPTHSWVPHYQTRRTKLSS